MTPTYKFRAWDALNGQWIDIYRLVISSSGDIQGVESLAGDMFGLHQVILMQYTGVNATKDKAEVYVGDIVRINHWLNGKIEHSHLSTVIEVPGGWSVDPCCLHESIHGAHEVIGNLHENPELTP